MAAETVENEVIQLLKTDSKGWIVALFEDQIKITTCLCASCNSICCDAVELACDHDDDADIYPHCKNCLNNLIKNNNNKCPINSHSDPVVMPIRSIRRQVSKSKVYCPYSVQYKLQQSQNKNDNAKIIDTIGGDEKEGIAVQNYEMKQDENACKWSGTLSELIKTHMSVCVQKYNPSFMQKISMKKLQDENLNLRQIVNTKDANIVKLQQEIESLNTKIKTQSEQNKQLQNEAMKLFHKLDKQDNDISSKVNTLQTQICSTEQQMQKLKTENEKLRDKNSTLEVVINELKHERSQLISAKTNIVSMQVEIESLKSLNTTLISERDSLKEELSKMRNDDEKQYEMPASIEEACNKLYSDNPTFSWFTSKIVDAKAKVLRLDQIGNGLNKLKQYLSSQKENIVFFLLRVNCVGGNGSVRAKFIYGRFVGTGVKFMAKAKLTPRLGYIADKFPVKHLTKDCDDKMNDWTPEMLSREFLRIGGAHKPIKYDYGGGCVYNVK
eukprot:471430_1